MSLKYRRGIVFLPILLIILAMTTAGSVTAVVVTHPQIISTIKEKITGKPASSSTTAEQTATNLDSFSAQGAAQSSTILVKFKTSTNSDAIGKIHQTLNTKVQKSISKIGVEVVSLPSGSNVGDFITRFKGHAEVEFAEPNYLAKVTLTPNDSLYSSEWDLQKIGAPAAWDLSQEPIGPIAVIDTGVDSSHPDLSGEVLSGYNFVGDNTNTTDDNGHGTHVTGTIAAVSNNGTGIASIGFKGSILPVKVLDTSGIGTYDDVADGIIYATDHNIKIINMSLGGPNASKTLQSAIDYATGHGVFVIAAAGNTGSSAIEYPAGCTGVLAVSATTTDDTLASFSSYGSNIFASAPGVNITSTYNNGNYKSLSGTSMSAPHLSGLIGIALSYAAASNITLSRSQLLNDIKATSDKVGTAAYDTNGWNQYFGYGRIDAGKLLTTIKASSATVPVISPTPETPVSPKTTPKASNVFSFNIELKGTIDSVDPTNLKISVKINSISQNIAIPAGNLVNVLIAPTSTIKLQGQSVGFASFVVGQNINAKAVWADNQITASKITIQNAPATSATPAKSVAPAITTQNAPAASVAPAAPATSVAPTKSTQSTSHGNSSNSHSKR